MAPALVPDGATAMIPPATRRRWNSATPSIGRMTSPTILAVVLACGLAACSGDAGTGADSSPDASSDAPSDAAASYPDAPASFPDVDLADVAIDVPYDSVEPDACAVVRDATLVRHRSVPGGRQFHLRLSDGDGWPLDGAYADCVIVEDATAGTAPVVWTRGEAEPGATLIVARWTPGEAEVSRAWIDAYIASRPARERIAIWAWSDTLLQVVPSTTDRARIDARLDRVWRADDATPVEFGTAALVASELWERIEEDSLLGARTVVFVAPELDLPEWPDIDRDQITDHWVVASAADDIDNVRAHRIDGDPLDTVASVSGHLDAEVDAGLAVLAWCDNGERLDLTFSSGDDRLFRTTIGDAADEDKGAPCDLAAALEAAPAPFPTLSMAFDDAEWATYQARYDARNKDDFVGAIQLGEDARVGRMTAHFRGQSSMDCVRKNFAVDLDGGDARYVADGSATDEFYLISMCLDELYINQINGDRLMADLGVWHVELAPVELRIQDQSQGVYLFVEQVQDQIRRDISRATALIRRRTDIDGKPAEVKWTTDPDEAAVLARYDRFLGSFDEVEGRALVEALRDRMDLDQYLRWIALMSALGNGDYVDEAFFIATDGVDAEHREIEYYLVHGWDPDDLFSVCHHGGRFAIEDPHGLLYCAEAVLDHRIFADPVVYELYVDTLDALLQSLTDARFAEVSDRTAEELLFLFERDDVRGAMVEALADAPDFASAEGARAVIEGATDALQGRYAERRSLLLDRIAAYRTR